MKTAVAFFIFNRPYLTTQVFQAIREAKPPKLLVVADGPRDNYPGDVESSTATRSVISQVDWDCEVLTTYSEVNLGCRERIVSGLDWFFDTVEEEVILEDDCLPHPTFFQFCDELLEYYRQDTRVMHIAGSNLGLCCQYPQESYFFSRLAPIWGWATWRRAWRYFDANIQSWQYLKHDSNFANLFGSKQEIRVRSKNWDAIFTGQLLSTWDYQWHLACLSQGNHTIIPSKNLISNLGFGKDATHTFDPGSPFANRRTSDMEFPLVHPKCMIRDSHNDNLFFKKMYAPSLYDKVARKAKQIFNHNQRSEIRDQRSEIRDQRSEIRDQRSEIRDQRSNLIGL
jgi:hypothetical protein